MNDSELRQQLIKLAFDNPDIREDILPLLKEAGDRGSKIEKLARQLSRSLSMGDDKTAISAMMDIISAIGWQLSDLGHDRVGSKVRGTATHLFQLLR